MFPQFGVGGSKQKPFCRVRPPDCAASGRTSTILAASPHISSRTAATAWTGANWLLLRSAEDSGVFCVRNVAATGNLAAETCTSMKDGISAAPSSAPVALVSKNRSMTRAFRSRAVRPDRRAALRLTTAEPVSTASKVAVREALLCCHKESGADRPRNGRPAGVRRWNNCVLPRPVIGAAAAAGPINGDSRQHGLLAGRRLRAEAPDASSRNRPASKEIVSSLASGIQSSSRLTRSGGTKPAGTSTLEFEQAGTIWPHLIQIQVVILKFALEYRRMPNNEPVRIAMWSGPRNISTAMMRSWGNRPDTLVCDEPFYAHYLQATGRDHPGADEVIANGETDWRKVIARLDRRCPRRQSRFLSEADDASSVAAGSIAPGWGT